ncbi:hypothetical protein ACIBL8_44040 [Streptomyces sp. NPDC050523]|uniref:hypothetical protein n=1 Tax=Streptomyces sp. NPDC050523 TaxID=3365622 RepID=UPI0037B6DB47
MRLLDPEVRAYPVRVLDLLDPRSGFRTPVRGPEPWDDDRRLWPVLQLGIVVILKFYTQYGRFPRGRFELPGEAAEVVARQVQVPALELDTYECDDAVGHAASPQPGEGVS